MIAGAGPRWVRRGTCRHRVGPRSVPGTPGDVPEPDVVRVSRAPLSAAEGHREEFVLPLVCLDRRAGYSGSPIVIKSSRLSRVRRKSLSNAFGISVRSMALPKKLVGSSVSRVMWVVKAFPRSV